MVVIFSQAIKHFLERSPDNASYTSHNTATELLTAASQWLRDDVLKAVRASPAIALLPMNQLI